MLTDFEGLEKVFSETTKTKEFKILQEDFNKSKAIYIIGNGGNMAVASHGAADITRLTDKAVYALDSQCIGTSIANDYGYDKLFTRWLEVYSSHTDVQSLVIGLSGSGNSKNVLSALDWANNRFNFKCALVSGQKSRALAPGINEVCFDSKYFHTAEILSLMMIYELIHGNGKACPTINEEIVRKWGKDTP